MNRRTLLLTLFFISILSKNFSQEIKFHSTEYDFGVIKEEEGLKTGRFIFNNTGNDTLKILGVRPSCGCTASQYTLTPILPGGEGFIDATYNPAGRPGKFNKSISVTTNSKTNPNISLTIKGEVIPHPKTKADEYPVEMGSLKFTSNHIAFNDIKNTESKTDTIKIFNNGKKPISLLFTGLPEFLNVEAKPALLEPQKEGLITVTYYAQKRNDWGFLLDQFTITTNDENNELKYITVSANIIEDFSMLTAKQLKKSPSIQFDTVNYNFGTVKAGETVKGSFNFQNKGKNKLIIRKITSNSENLTFSITNNSLKKNDKAQINFVYNTANKPSKHHKTLVVITNDPKNPVIVLHIQGITE